jgi:hypothetical protein
MASWDRPVRRRDLLSDKDVRLKEKDMTLMIREPLIATGTFGHTPARPRPGIAFVPCALCLAPVDLAAVPKGHAQLCDEHRAADYAPLS